MLQGGGGGGVAGAARAAAVGGPMEPRVLGKDKLKRPKRWSDWKKDAENKMSLLGIVESGQKMNFLRSCAGAELTEFLKKEVRVQFEATMDGEVAVPAHTYEQVVENVQCLCNSVSAHPLVCRSRLAIQHLHLGPGRSRTELEPGLA